MKKLPRLPKLTLAPSKKDKGWDLTNDKTNNVVKKFPLKERATKGGILAKALGKQGGSVRIKKMDGKFQEERTFPGDRDPKSSRG